SSPKFFVFFFQAEDGIRDFHVTGVQTCALPICPTCPHRRARARGGRSRRRARRRCRRRRGLPGLRRRNRPTGSSGRLRRPRPRQIGRASCRERGESAVGGGGASKIGAMSSGGGV